MLNSTYGDSAVKNRMDIRPTKPLVFELLLLDWPRTHGDVPFTTPLRNRRGTGTSEICFPPEHTFLQESASPFKPKVSLHNVLLHLVKRYGKAW